MNPRSDLLRVLKLISKALFGREWSDGVEHRLWEFVFAADYGDADGLRVLSSTARDLFQEARGWFTSSPGGPAFVDARSWDQLRLESRRTVVQLSKLRDPAL